MAAPQLRRKSIPIPYHAYGDTDRDIRRASVASNRFEADRAALQFDFSATAGPAARYWRAIAILTSVTIAAIGAVAAIAYFAGVIAAGIAVAAAVAVIGFGNWILNNTIDLP